MRFSPFELVLRTPNQVLNNLPENNRSTLGHFTRSGKFGAIALEQHTVASIRRGVAGLVHFYLEQSPVSPSRNFDRPRPLEPQVEWSNNAWRALSAHGVTRKNKECKWELRRGSG